MKEIGFKAVDDIVYGVHDGYLVSITDGNGITSMFVDLVLPSIDCEDSEKIKKIISINSKQYSILRAEVNETGALIVFASTVSSFNKLKDFFYTFLQQLRSAKIGGASICSNCGKPISSLKIISIYEHMHTCDPDCASHLVSKHIASRKRKRPNFLPGLLGALLGALVGVVPLIVLSRLDMFVLWCGIFIGLFAKGGYELFGGRNCIGKIICLPIISFIAIIPSLFYSYCYSLNEIWLGKHYVVSYDKIVELVYSYIIESGPIRTMLLTETVIAFSFAILGLLLTMRFVRKIHKEEVFIV